MVLSAKRSEITQAPACSAGRMARTTCSRRAAKCSMRLGDAVPGQVVGLGSQQHAPDRLGAGRAAGLPRPQHAVAGGLQRGFQQPRLGGLARPLPAFERDEAAAHPQVPVKKAPMTAGMRGSRPSLSISAPASSGIDMVGTP